MVGFLVIASLWMEIRPTPTARHPYLARDVTPGEPVESALEWRDIARGVLEPVDGTGFARRRLTAGQPLLVGDTTDEARAAPSGWWLVDVTVPAETSAGSQVQLVILPAPGHRAVPPIGGLVTAVRPGEYDGDSVIGSVAFPPDLAATAAVAIAEDRVSVLVQADHATATG